MTVVAAKHEAAGVQTLARAVAVLQRLGEAGASGLRLIDIQRTTGLTRPTAHRILAALGHHGFTSRDATGRRYFLGPELAILGRSAASHTLDLHSMCQHNLAELARESGDTAFLMARSGHEIVCLDLKLGSYPVKTMTADIGTRRPLGVGAAGVAVLAALDPAEMEGALRAGRDRLRDYVYTSESAIRRAVRDARAQGYALSNGEVLPSVRGLAIAVRDKGKPIAALCVASIRERISDSRVPGIVALLQRHRGEIERQLP